MNKVFKIKIKDKEFTLVFNMIFAEQLAKILKCEATPEELISKLLELNQKSSFLMFKAILYCGILGNDYLDGFEESISQKEVGVLISESNEKQLSEMFNVMSKELGFDLKAEKEVEATEGADVEKKS